jgi:hypothetical protein
MMLLMFRPPTAAQSEPQSRPQPNRCQFYFRPGVIGVSSIFEALQSQVSICHGLASPMRSLQPPKIARRSPSL